MSFPQYECYKATGIKPLGALPRHWELSQLGYESWVRARLGWKGLKAEEYVEEGYIFLATPNIKGRDIDFNNVNYITKDRYDESPEIKLRVGDVLLAKDGSTLGTVNIVRTLPTEATVNSSLAVITPYARLRGSYLFYLLQSSYIEQTIQYLKGGMGVPHLFQDDLNKFRIPLPPLSEQSTIITFLDRETAKIDALVEEQKRLIDLLKEKRRAVISYAVTKGLDPKAPTKHSGVEWLGEVPEHWEVKRLKYLGEAITGLTYAPDDVCGEGIGTLVLRSSNVQNGMIAFDDNVYVSSAIPEELRTRIGDILICSRNGSRALIGKNARIEPSSAALTFGAFMTVFRSEANDYLYWVFNSPVFDYQSSAFLTATINQLTIGNLYSFEVPFPPAADRQAIATFLNSATTEMNEFIAGAETAIALLQERRSALISAAVTGKIDVRGSVSVEAEAA